MSFLLGVVQSTAQAVVAATPAVTATPTPTPEAVQAVATSSSSLLGAVNALASQVSQTDVVAVASGLAVAVQALLNKIPFFTHVVNYVQDVRRFFLAVLVPSALTFLAGLATGDNTLHLAPVVFLGAQVVFYTVRFLVSKATAKAVPATVEAAPQTSVDGANF